MDINEDRKLDTNPADDKKKTSVKKRGKTDNLLLFILEKSALPLI